MKRLSFLSLILVGCIQTDLEDPFPPTLRIDNAVSEIDFRVSGTYPLSAVYTDDTGEPADVPILWESGDESILSFDENIATVHTEGLVLIRANANGLSSSEAIETLPSRGSLQITGYTSKLQSGNATPFRFNFIDVQGNTDNSVTAQWASLDEGIATVDENGWVSALGTGITDIVVTFDGVSSAIKLEVSNDPVMLDPVVRIVQFARFLSMGDSFDFQADYYNEEGLAEDNATLSWTSSDESILSIGENGVATANGAGSVSITASFQNTSASTEVRVEATEVTKRTGSLMGTGYAIEGDFTLSRNEDGEVILTVLNYSPDGPGPYFYLTNQNNNVANGLNLGEARTRGNITINVSEIDRSIDLTTYNFLMVWCEPFRVRLGFGEFDN